MTTLKLHLREEGNPAVLVNWRNVTHAFALEDYTKLLLVPEFPGEGQEHFFVTESFDDIAKVVGAVDVQEEMRAYRRVHFPQGPWDLEQEAES